MGINTLAPNSALQQRIGLSYSAINTNDLIYQSDTGISFVPNPVFPMSRNSNVTAGISLNRTTSPYTTGGGIGGPNTSDPATNKNIIELSNGNYVYGYTGWPTDAAPNSRVWFDIVSPMFGNIQTVQVSTNTGVTSVKLQRINNSNFVIAWNNGSEVLYSVYTNGGDLVTSNLVSAVSGTGGICFNIEALNSGDFIIGFNNSSNACQFIRYNSSGTAQGAAVTVQASATAQYIDIMRQSNGGFVIMYYKSSATSAYNFAIYTSTGTIVGSLTSIITSISAFQSSQSYDQLLVELPNGNIAFIVKNGSGYASYAVYSSTGTLIQSATQVETNAANLSIPTNQKPGLCATNTGFTILLIAGQNAFVYTYNNSGVVTNGNRINSFISVNNFPNSQISIYLSAINTSYVAFIVGNDGSNRSGVNLIQFAINEVIGTQLVFIQQPSGNSTSYNIFSFLSSDLNLIFKLTTGGGAVNLGNYNVGRKSLLGVAQESVASNSLFKVNTSGTYTLNTNYIIGSTVNDRTATPVGSRGLIFGTTAILDGVV